MISTDLIAAVRDVRKAQAESAQEIKELREHFEATIAHKLALHKLNVARLSITEETLRQAIISEYLATGNKAPAPGCSIRILTTLTYSELKAFEWAKEHGMCLKLDISPFEKIAKAQPLDFVRYIDEPVALISQDLEKALAEK